MAKLSDPKIDKLFEGMSRETANKMVGTGTGLKRKSAPSKKKKVAKKK